jgi:hypothetical protein
MKKLLVLLLTCAFLVAGSLRLSASSATSPTRTLDNKFNLVWTQDAYLPQLTVTDLGLKKPADAAIDERDHLYIADRDNKRVVEYDTTTNTVANIITHPDLKTPTGIYLTETDVYVADTSAEAVFRFDKAGNLIEKIGRPTTASFGDTPYKPAKVAVDNRGNLYIVSEGVYNGIIQLSSAGEFLGYFSSNKVSLSWVQMLQDMFFTEEQKALLTGRVPTTFSNVFLDSDGIVYSTTMGIEFHGAKKHNTAGQDMWANQMLTWGPDDLTDITVDKDGIVYASSKSGVIVVYTNDGQFTFFFGSFYSESDIAGLFASLTSIAVDSKGTLWTLDAEKSYIQSFKPTEYAQSIYEATRLFNDGRYDEATAIWTNVLRLNQMSVLAHNGIGMNYLNQQKYDQAMIHFELSGNRPAYSDAFWEVRNAWLQSNLSAFLGAGVVAVGGLSATRKLRKKSKLLTTLRSSWKKFLNLRLVSDLLLFISVMRHPIDTFYDIKAKKKGSLLSATLVYLAFFGLFIWYTLGKGFIYQWVSIEDVDMNALVIGFFSLTLLFVFCNYLVSSINDGEGGLADLYKMMAYSFGPMMIGYVLIIGLSYVMTFNESFFLGLIANVSLLWTGVNLFLGIQEVHNYETKHAVKSMIMTVLFMLMIAVILLIVILMTEQVYMFFEALIKEAWRNVTR